MIAFIRTFYFILFFKADLNFIYIYIFFFKCDIFAVKADLIILYILIFVVDFLNAICTETLL